MTSAVDTTTLSQLAFQLEQTLSPDPAVRLPAEKILLAAETSTPHLGLYLLQIAELDGAALNVRVGAAINFKNYVKRNWRLPVEAGAADRVTPPEDRVTIRTRIVDQMLRAPELIQNQLSDAVSIIGQEDFPERWPDLLSLMVAKFQVADFHVINGVLRTAHSLFKRYRHEFRSDKLWREIKFVLEHFAQPLTNLLEATVALAEQHASDDRALRVIFSSLLLICKIFYSLNFQDLPEFFEDNMSTWMRHQRNLLKADNALLVTADAEDVGALEQLKSQICDNVAIYAQKYDEEFKPYLPDFVRDVWALLLHTGQEPKYDLLASNAIQFLASVAEREQYKSLFSEADTLQQICEKVVIPNMHFRASDEELFQDNAEEYIRRDIEGSDVDTRRRAACDLVRALCKSFEGPVISNFSGYVAHLLAQYGAAPDAQWRAKDAALFLVTSLAARGTTQRHGVTQTTELVNLAEFFHAHVLPELSDAAVSARPVIKADCLKYVMTFRSQLPAMALRGALPAVLALLDAEPLVVHTYAAACIEKLLTVQLPVTDGGAGGGQLLNATHVAQPAAALGALLRCLQREGSEENEYVMKCVMRLLAVLQEAALPAMDQLVPGLVAKLAAVSRNPSRPHFNHYLFETLCLCVRLACRNAGTGAVQHFEAALFPLFQDILQRDVTEFLPYVFQLLSVLLEQHAGAGAGAASAGIPPPYLALFPFLLSPVLWERPGNVPALARLLVAFVARGGRQVEPERVNALLGVFQKLVASKSSDLYGFQLLGGCVEFLSREQLQPHLRQVFVLLFQRLTSSKTAKFVRGLLVFFNVFVLAYSASELVRLVDDIQPRMFGMLLERLMIPEVGKVPAAGAERVMCAMGLTRLLAECPEMLVGEYSQLWPAVLTTLLKLLELPPEQGIMTAAGGAEPTAPGAVEHFIEVDEVAGYQSSFSQLQCAGRAESSALRADVRSLDDAKLHLARALAKLSAGSPGKIGALIEQGVDGALAKLLAGYLGAARVQLS